MTALNLITGKSAAWLVTDMALFHRDQIIAVGSKVTSSGRLRIALASVGSIWPGFHPFVGEWLDRQPSQAAAIEGLPVLMAGIGEQLLKHPRPRKLDGLGKFSIARDESGKIEIRERGEPDRPALRLYAAIWHMESGQPLGICIKGAEKDGEWWMSSPAGVRGRYSTPKVDYKPPPVMFPAAALQLVTRQRELTDRTDYRLVGGGVELTTVNSQGVKTEKLCDWPEALDQPINI